MLTDRELQQVRNEGRDEAADEIERLRSALAQSCDEHRSQMYDSGPGGGCVLLADAVAAERERCARLVETQDTNGDQVGGWFAMLAAKIRA